MIHGRTERTCKIRAENFGVKAKILSRILCKFRHEAIVKRISLKVHSELNTHLPNTVKMKNP
jgi:hypothetical protein